MLNFLCALCLTLLLPLAASALPIAVDPATPLTGTYAVEWNTAGNFEGWTTTQVTGATVSGGVLSATASGTDPQVTRSNFAGPDLDLGFNDFIELRLQVPASFGDDIHIYYGTTATTGFSAARLITIPNATIPRDGAFHTYRIDIGTEPWWRAVLRDLRIDPGSVPGVAFAIDYLRVGDEPDPTLYQPRFTAKCPAAGGATPADAYYGPGQSVSSMESKHFRFLWNNNVTTHTSWTSSMAKGTLRNLEEAWQVHVKILGCREPCFNVGTTSGTAYKLNVTGYYNGYWAGLDDHGGISLAQLNITPDGLQVDPPTWVIPHELMHCFQFHNTSGNVNGEWFETHANYGRERWLHHYQVFYPNRSNIEALGVRDGHFMMSSGRNYYLTWPFMYYVDENPDSLPDLYDGMMAKVWQETQAGEFSMMTLDRLTPATSLKDIVGYYARRCATWDFSNQSAMTAELNSQDPARNARHLFTDLIRHPDDPTWWRVPTDKAPAQGAYAMHEIIPAGSGAGRVVTVNLQGLADSARGADWRASLITVSDTGAERYTPLWSNGSRSITLAADENKLYLSVAGTPEVFHYGGHDEASFRFRSHPSRSRFHYKLQVVGANPRERDNGSTAGLIQHANGGGYKAGTASVAATAYIGPNARVLGSATVSNTARIEDYAVVQDNALVRNSAVVSGHAWVRGTAVIQEFARVRDWAIVDSGTISGNARVLEHATVQANMQDTAVAKGSALHQSGGTLSGNAIVDGDYMFNKSLTGGITFGHLPWVGIPDNFTTATPTGLYAAYDFGTPHDSRALDQYGITDAFTTGSPTWIFTDGKRKGFLTFNGSSHSIVLDRSVADSREFTFAAWVKPAGGPANQAVLWLGATTTRRLSLTASDSAGLARFSIVNGGAEQTLTTAALPVGVWSHIAVTLNGSTGVLYVNGTAAASGPVTIRPDQLLAANTTTAAQHNYLARSEGSAMPMFQGALDDAQFFSSALSAAQLTAATVPLLNGVGSLLLSDSFTSESYSAADFNSTLAVDQQGLLAPTAYTVTTGGQGWQAQHGNGGTMLLVGDAGYSARASLNEDFSIAANGLDLPIAFQIDAWVDTGNDDCWSSIAIGSGQNLIATDSAVKFGILPVKNGTLQVWMNGSQASLASHSDNSYRIVLSDTAGNGSAFNGCGSKAALYNGTTLLGTYTLPQLASGDGYLNFGAQAGNGYTITRVDTLSISTVPPSVFTWAGGSGNWTDLNWLPGSVAGPTASGLTGIVSTGTVTLGQATLGSFAASVAIGAEAMVELNTAVDISLGRAVIFSGAGAISKSGTGRLSLSGPNTYSGGMTVEGGTLAGVRGTLGPGAVTVNAGGTLRLDDQWVFCGSNPYNVAEVAPYRLTLNAGSVLALDSVQGFVNGVSQLYLNGGSISGGPDDFRGDVYLFNGNQQITAGGATSSAIASVIGLTGNSNTVTVETNSTLNITARVKNSDWFGNGSTPGGFVKAGAGTLTLSGANSYSRLTDITAGTLLAMNNTALGPGGHNGDTMTYIRDGATLALQGGITLDEHFHVWGAGVGGLGAVRSISGNNALINAPGGGAGYTLRSSTTVGVDADTLTVSGFYEDGGSFSLTKVGAGTLVLTTASTYSGGTSVEGGTLIPGAGGLASGEVTLAAGATLATTSASSTGLAALYYNSAAIDQASIATLPALLAHFGANTPAPTLVNTASSMNFANNGSGFPPPYNSGALNFEAFYSGKINIATPGTYTFNTSSDDGSMLFIDGQAVVANNLFQPVTTRTGSIALTVGMHDIVIAFNQGGGGYGMNAQMSGADNTTMKEINTANAGITPDLVVGSLAGEGNVALITGNLITGIDNSSATFTGAISGIGSVTKFGSGMQRLAGANSYSGATSIQSGTLRIDGDSSGATGALTVASGAFLGGSGSYGGSITLNDGAALNCELNLTDSTLTCSGQLSFTNLDIAACSFTVAPGAAPPFFRSFTLIEAASLGSATFANAEGTIDGVPARLYISGSRVMLDVGQRGTVISIF